MSSLDTRLMHRSAELMQRYSDHPMDLADATLVALAEVQDLRTIFTRRALSNLPTANTALVFPRFGRVRIA